MTTTQMRQPIDFAEHVDRYRSDGFTVVRNVLRQEEVDAVRDAFMGLAAAGPVEGISDGSWREYADDDPLRLYPRMLQPHRHPSIPAGQFARDVLIDDRIGALLRALLDDEPLGAQTMFYFKPPGSRGQDLHQDNFYLRVHPGTCIAVWIAIDEADPANGGMVAVPGSHRLDLLCPDETDRSKFFTSHHLNVPDGMEAVDVPLRAGDALVFGGSVIHGSYPNTSTDRFRRALINHYIPESAVEVSGGYLPLVRFDGTELTISEAAGGGPCGGI